MPCVAALRSAQLPAQGIVALCSAWLPAHASRTAVVLRTDALIPAQALPAESTKGTLTVETFQLLLDTPEWRALSPYVSVTHLYGDCNPPSRICSPDSGSKSFPGSVRNSASARERSL